MTDFNASDRDVTRAIRSWLHEDRHEDVSASRRRCWTAWRRPHGAVPVGGRRGGPDMNKFAKSSGAAAAVGVAGSGPDWVRHPCSGKPE